MKEIVERWLNMTASQMRLQAGECSAQEIRTVKAVLRAILAEFAMKDEVNGSTGSISPDAASHSAMLSQIAGEVSDWCINENCTTLDAVRLVIADYHKWRGVAERLRVEASYDL